MGEDVKGENITFGIELETNAINTEIARRKFEEETRKNQCWDCIHFDGGIEWASPILNGPGLLHWIKGAYKWLDKTGPFIPHSTYVSEWLIRTVYDNGTFGFSKHIESEYKDVKLMEIKEFQRSGGGHIHIGLDLPDSMYGEIWDFLLFTSLLWKNSPGSWLNRRIYSLRHKNYLRFFCPKGVNKYTWLYKNSLGTLEFRWNDIPKDIYSPAFLYYLIVFLTNKLVEMPENSIKDYDILSSCIRTVSYTHLTLPTKRIV